MSTIHVRNFLRMLAAASCLSGVLLALTAIPAAQAVTAGGVVVVKTGPAVSPPGQVLRYEIEISNPGRITLYHAQLNDVSTGLGTPRIVEQPATLLAAGVRCVAFPCNLIFLDPGVVKHFVIEYDPPPCGQDGAAIVVTNKAWVTGEYEENVSASTAETLVETSVGPCATTTTSSSTTTTSTTSTTSSTTTSTTPSTTTTTPSTTTTTSTTSTTTSSTTPSTFPPVTVAPATTPPGTVPPTSPPSSPAPTSAVPTVVPSTALAAAPTSTAAAPVAPEVLGVQVTNAKNAPSIAFTGARTSSTLMAGIACLLLGVVLFGLSRRVARPTR